ncbi:hypothetical protein PG996_014546 [Apiospora saccharicola]|uniref:GPI inositol-deacylase n=1 Tax=Apiospora saccharicola TaxID=335842 RepID=A0ABR1TIQ0_9PEZI
MAHQPLSQQWQESGRNPTSNSSLQVPPRPGPRGRQSAPGVLKGRLGSFRRVLSPSPSFTTGNSDGVKGPVGLNLLYEPSEPLIEFVFVHGLGGGSRKTWSETESPESFWPREWLPFESGFRHVRIHSFGYDADWTSSQSSSLTIHDFGQALLADLSTSSQIKKNGDTPIVLIAHSMGGLVVKKVTLASSQRKQSFKTDKHLASRVHSLFFLATPHRGADSANLLSNLLSIKGAKAFAINDEFRHVCTDLHLWSLFEGAATSSGPTSVTIVEKESAVLGLPGERTRYIQADHRHICKFGTPSDPNYAILRDCLRTSVIEAQQISTSERSEDHKVQMKSISEALENAQRPEMDLLSAVDQRHDESGSWLTEHESFNCWLHGLEPVDLAVDSSELPHPPRTLWLNGPPGSGKSVLAGHVIRFLESSNIDCAYFFFKGSNKASISHLLLSLAFQMAELNFEVRRAFLNLLKDGEILNSLDPSVIWNTLFLGNILKINLPQTHVWVIDALDECPSRQLGSLVQMISKIDPSSSFRFFLTSRPSENVERLLNQEKVKRFEINTGRGESLKDISAYLRSRLSHAVPSDGPSDTGEKPIVSQILEKSNGVFLWASLIVARLQDTYTLEKMHEVLDEVPSEMNGLYRGIIEALKGSPSLQLAQCMLRWVVCSPQPLSTDLLIEAVRLDISQTLTTSDKIPHICGNLVNVDNRSRVQLMHQTVKEFLITQESDYFVRWNESHSQIAAKCLEHLTDARFSHSRPRRTVQPATVHTSVFDDYADSNFSYHLSHASTDPDLELLSLLATFCKDNIRAWIERTARLGKLSAFQKCIENVKRFLHRYANDHSPLELEHQVVSRVVDDLTRLLAVFGTNIVDTPPAIHSLVPLLCPTTSFFHQTFATQARQRLICNFNEQWDERISCLLFPSRVLCVASNDRYLAVGLTNGNIHLHRVSTFELVTVMKQGEPVRRLAFGNTSNLLVSGSPRKVALWDSDNVQRWTAPVSTLPLSLGFSYDDSKVLVPVRDGVVMTFRSLDGRPLEQIPILEDSSDSDSDSSTHGGKGMAATIVRLCPALDLMAVSYRNSHLALCYMETEERIGKFEKEGYEGSRYAPQILDVAFSTVPELNLAAVTYQDGEVVTFNTLALQQKDTCQLHCHILATSPDGRTLAAGDNDGVISLFGFENLRLIYRISSLDERIMGIIFSSNNLRFFDIRGSSCNVWEPSVLIRKNFADDSSSEAEDQILPVQEAKFTRHFANGTAITVIVQAGSSNYLFCGREDGSITYHDIRTGRRLEKLQYHARLVAITQLEWHAKTQTLFSVDASGRCIGTRFSASPSGQLQLKSHIFDHRAGSTTQQALVNSDATAFLVSSTVGEELWHSGTGLFASSKHSEHGGQWLIHPTESSKLVLLTDANVMVFSWETLDVPVESYGLSKSSKTDAHAPSTQPTDWFSRHELRYLLSLDPTSTPSQGSALSLLDLSGITNDGTDKVTIVLSRTGLPEVKYMIGFHRSDLYFLTRQGWVCSLSAKQLPSVKSYTRHFFIPPLWQVGNDFASRVLSSKSLAFAYRGELVIFNRFLEFEEKVDLEVHGREGISYM